MSQVTRYQAPDRGREQPGGHTAALATTGRGRSAHDIPMAQAAPADVDARTLRYENIALVDLLDRLLAGGVVISGEIRLAIADVDLVNVSLRALISSVSTVLEHSVQGEPPARGGGADQGEDW